MHAARRSLFSLKKKVKPIDVQCGGFFSQICHVARQAALCRVQYRGQRLRSVGLKIERDRAFPAPISETRNKVRNIAKKNQHTVHTSDDDEHKKTVLLFRRAETSRMPVKPVAGLIHSLNFQLRPIQSTVPLIPWRSALVIAPLLPFERARLLVILFMRNFNANVRCDVGRGCRHRLLLGRWALGGRPK